jgi:Protein of unknown function (DUF2867)
VAVVQRRSIVATERCDYADAFEVTLAATDGRSAEELVRAGLESVPQWLGAAVLIAHRYVLRFDLAPLSAPDHLLGWEIADREPDSIRLSAAGPLLDGVLVAKRIPPSTAVLETFVNYRRPMARLVWAAVAPIHRAVVPVLLRGAATGFRRAVK